MVAFQEVPVWALDRLEAWSGMTAVRAVAMRPLGGRSHVGSRSGTHADFGRSSPARRMLSSSPAGSRSPERRESSA